MSTEWQKSCLTRDYKMRTNLCITLYFTSVIIEVFHGHQLMYCYYTKHVHASRLEMKKYLRLFDRVSKRKKHTITIQQTFVHAGGYIDWASVRAVKFHRLFSSAYWSWMKCYVKIYLHVAVARHDFVFFVCISCTLSDCYKLDAVVIIQF